jgi:hypothetical protein
MKLTRLRTDLELFPAPVEASPVQSFETRKDGPYETRQTATELWANIGASVNLRKTRLEMVGGEREVTA